MSGVMVWAKMHFKMLTILQQVVLTPDDLVLPSLLTFVPFSRHSPLQLPSYPTCNTLPMMISYSFSMIKAMLPLLCLFAYSNIEDGVFDVCYHCICDLVPRPRNPEEDILHASCSLGVQSEPAPVSNNEARSSDGALSAEQITIEQPPSPNDNATPQPINSTRRRLSLVPQRELTTITAAYTTEPGPIPQEEQRRLSTDNPIIRRVSTDQYVTRQHDPDTLSALEGRLPRPRQESLDVMDTWALHTDRWRAGSPPAHIIHLPDPATPSIASTDDDHATGAQTTSIVFDHREVPASEMTTARGAAELVSTSDADVKDFQHYRVTAFTILPAHLAAQFVSRVATHVLMSPFEALTVRVVATSYLASGLGLNNPKALNMFSPSWSLRQIISGAGWYVANLGAIYMMEFVVGTIVWSAYVKGAMWWGEGRLKKRTRNNELAVLEGLNDADVG